MKNTVLFLRGAHARSCSSSYTHHGSKRVGQITLHEQNTLEYRQGEPPKKLQKPSHLLIVDDAQGTDLYSNARHDLLMHIVIKHRHIPITITLLA